MAATNGTSKTGKSRAAKKSKVEVVKKGQAVYQRILLKLSGESFQGPQGFGIHGDTIREIAREVKEVHDLGVEVAIMVGGGNIFRGARQKGLVNAPLPLPSDVLVDSSGKTLKNYDSSVHEIICDKTFLY